MRGCGTYSRIAVGAVGAKALFNAFVAVVLSLALSGCGSIKGYITDLSSDLFFNSFKISFDSNSITMTEGSASVVAVVLSNPREQDTVINVAFNQAVADGSADFSGVSTQVTIPKGSVATSVSISTVDDAIYEGTEEFQLVLTPVDSSVGTDKNALNITLNDNESAPTIALTASAQNVNEGAGTGTITAQLSHLSSLPIKVAYAVSTNGATSGSDFTLTSGELSFPALSLSQNISFAVIDDALPESNEDFTATLGAITGSAILGATSAHTVTIIDNETSAMTIDDVSITEGGLLTFTATLSAAVVSNVTFDWTTTNGTGTAGTDYTSASGSETIVAGGTTKAIQVTTINTAAVCEANKTLTVVLSNLVGANMADSTGIGTILDDDLPSLSIANNSGTEGSNVNITATLSVACPTKTVSFNWSNATNTATATTDYVTVTNQAATIAAGSTTTTLMTSTVGDTLHEANETFTVSLSGIANAVGGTTNATGTITDNDAAPTISIANVSVAEGTGAGTTNATFTVTAAAVSGDAITVDYATSNSTATTADSDYTSTTGTATISAGATTTTFNVPIGRDSNYELDETFSVTLSGGAAYTTAGSGLTATGTITNDDAAPTLSIDDVSVTEGSGAGTTTATFTITASTSIGSNITVAYATANGTATTGDSDYTSTSGTATITAGSTTTTVNVTIGRDAKDENDETFTVGLSTPTNATISDNSGTGTIQDDDSAPTLSIADVSGAEAGGSLVFTVTKTGSTALDVTVDYATSNGTAAQPGDYTSTSGTLTILAAASTGTITVPLANDSIAEDDETVAVALTNATNSSITTASATGTITNDDAPTITSISPTSGTNAGGTTITLTGTGYLASATATVGGTACTSPTVVSGTSFTCVTPLGSPGTADVVFSNVVGSQPSGTRSVTSTGGFTYIANSWNFGHSGDFTYTGSLFTTSQASNNATLTPADLTTNSQTEFNAGTHSWTKYDNVNSRLTIDLSASAATELNSSWTPQWASLIAYWNFNSGYTDSTANASVGVANGAASITTPGKFGTGALTGDGNSGSFVEVTDSARFYNKSQLSVAFWAKVSSKDAYQSFIAVGHNFAADTDTAFRITFDNSADEYIVGSITDTSDVTRGIGSTAPFPLNTWTHVALTYDGSTIAFYINGVSQGTTSMTGNIHNAYTANSVLSILGSAPGHWGNVDGSIDEVGIWSKGLTSAEILQIYNSSPVPYDPVYTSPVLNALQSSQWLSASWVTSIPFGKELPGDVTGDGTADSEVPVASVDYPSLGTNLASGLVGLWHLNETAVTNATADSSGKGNNGTYPGSPTIGVTGPFNTAFRFGSANYVSVAHSSSVAITGNISVQAWVNQNSINTTFPAIVSKSSTGNDFAYVLNYNSGASNIRFLIGDNAGSYDYASATAPSGGWHHIVGVADASWVYIYVDGVEKNKVARTVATLGNPSSRPLCIGALSNSGNCNDNRYTGDMDEVALWNRALSATEVQQLYRRGVNNVQFQYRACTQSDCSDNPMWKGPDNTASTYFSEASNMASVTSSGGGSGTINLVTPLITFSKWIAAVTGWSFTNDPAQYFQYKVKLSTTDFARNCGGSECLPDVISVTPTPVVSMTTAFGLPFPSAMNAFSVTATGDCGTGDTVRFQVSSNDGTTYKYWNGSAWTTVSSSTSYAQGATLTLTNTNIATLASSGTVRFRALVPSQYGKTCVLSNPSVSW